MFRLGGRHPVDVSGSAAPKGAPGQGPGALRLAISFHVNSRSLLRPGIVRCPFNVCHFIEPSLTASLIAFGDNLEDVLSESIVSTERTPWASNKGGSTEFSLDTQSAP
jgi:hypothetical protein